MSLDVTADRERLVYRYDRPTSLTEPADIVLMKTESASMGLALFPEAHSSELRVHTALDLFWFVVHGNVTFEDEKEDVIGAIGPEQGIVLPRGYAYRYDVAPDPDLGIFEAYRMTAADGEAEKFVDDRVWLSGPHAGPDGLAALDSIEKSPHAPAVFTYPRPVVTTGKAMDILTITDCGMFGFQVLRAGGETNMHSHAHVEGFWFVRRGKARFYTGGAEANIVLAELGPNEGVLIPRGYPYWFESVQESEDDECEILQFEVCDFRLSGKHEELTSDRKDYVPPGAELAERTRETRARFEATSDK